ncbi:alpha/beta-Hydrolases superfamily protein [Striga asiatica]|uniref:Alpha/beta-Hydrolases superfamily protein n=1 Tax=Striga asiatica TaxID=4170 RepID=A0A5A7QFZ5_STRAF|nr:alpha/beta-Hydrolases superfamily protein [Striga asiatica]
MAARRYINATVLRGVQISKLAIAHGSRKVVAGRGVDHGDLVVFVADIVTKLEYWIWKEIVLLWTIDYRNERGHALKCSHCIPLQLLDNSPLPYVIFCHGNRNGIFRSHMEYLLASSRSTNIECH